MFANLESEILIILLFPRSEKMDFAATLAIATKQQQTASAFNFFFLQARSFSYDCCRKGGAIVITK